MAIALDQDVGFSGTSTTQITVSGTFPAGALIVVVVGFATATSGQSISQSGSAFTNLFTRENAATNNLVYWVGYLANWAGGALSTTFTLSSAGKDAAARLLSFTGVAPSSPLLLSHDAGGAPKSTTMDSGAASGTTNPTDLLVGFFTWANTSDISGDSPGGTPSSGWTETAHSSGNSGNTPHGHALFTYQILNGSAVTNPDASVTFTSPSAGVSYSASIATFKAAGGSTIQGTLDFGHQQALGMSPGGLMTGQWGLQHNQALALTPSPLMAGTLDLGHAQGMVLSPGGFIAGQLALSHEQALQLSPGGLIQGQIGPGSQQALVLTPTLQASDNVSLQHQSALGLAPGALIQGTLDFAHSHGLAATWSVLTGPLKAPTGAVVDAGKPIGTVVDAGKPIGTVVNT